jgi:hypothetical protein
VARLSQTLPTDKKATARAYLESRGLKPESVEFEQGFKDNHQTLVIKQDGVTFDRLIDYQIGKKALRCIKPSVALMLKKLKNGWMI